MNITVLLVEPNQPPRTIQTEDTLEALQKLVGGYIEMLMPFDDDVAIICNEEGKINGLPLNRPIYLEHRKNISYKEMVNIFMENEKKGGNPITGYIVFSQENFSKKYTEIERTYEVSSRNKAYNPSLCGYSIFGNCLDHKDVNVRLDGYMADEKGGPNGWKIERCYLKDSGKRQLIDVIAGTFFICYAPDDSDSFQSLPEDKIKKYSDMFRI